MDLDGQNDLIRIQQAQNYGLGRFDQVTLSLWIRAADPTSDQQQIIFAEGDAEDGLVLYLEKSKLKLLAWADNFEGTNLRKVTLQHPGTITTDTWHHLAVIKVETVRNTAPSDPPYNLERVRYEMYLDGILEPAPDSGNQDLPDPRLCPVGPAFLGGPGDNATTWQGKLNNEISNPKNFAGILTDFRLWKVEKPATYFADTDRFVANMLPDPDLVIYLPLTESNGTELPDKANPENEAIIQTKKKALAVEDDLDLLTLEEIHTHYAVNEALTWTNYMYSGRLYIEDANSAIGVTFFSQFPNSENRYYALQRDAKQPKFHLVVRPGNLQTLTINTDTAPEPKADTWYQFEIEVRTIASTTEIKAKIKSEDPTDSTTYRIEAVDKSPIHITAGTVGLWTKDDGVRMFDDLEVKELGTNGKTLLVENFGGTATSQLPPQWEQVGTRFYFEHSTNLFETGQIQGNIVYGSDSKLSKVMHSHLNTAKSLEWTNYEFTGRLYFTDPDSSHGVTFFSQDPKGKHEYYRISKSNSDPNFALTAYPPVRADLLDGRKDSGTEAKVNTWYQFKILVKSNPVTAETQIQANVWEQNKPEPTIYIIDATDKSEFRLTKGTIGIWASGDGEKYADTLVVDTIPANGSAIPINLYQETFHDYQPKKNPDDWFDSPALDYFDPLSEEFKVKELPPDGSLGWQPVDTYPILPKPLNRQALTFDGTKQCAAADEVIRLAGSKFTLEAWVKPQSIKAMPILSQRQDIDGSLTFQLALTSSAQVMLSYAKQDNSLGTLRGNTPLNTNKFSHVAIAVDGTAATLYVNGQPQVLPATAEAINLKGAVLEVGRGGTLATPNQPAYFAGQMRDIRIWKTVRTEAEIKASQFARPEIGPDLIGYWPFEEADGNTTADQAADNRNAPDHKNALRLGGLEPDRRPTIPTPVATANTEQDFWRAERPVATLNAQGGLIYWRDESNAKPAPCQRRTVEVWFKATDKNISHRKQVIYQEGDDQQGLSIYLFDGYLYFGGYNILADTDNWGHWAGTWLRTNRLRSNRWHHVALVLDGRDELRENVLRAYLDGKLVDEGKGAQLTTHAKHLVLGGVGDDILFHDGESAHYRLSLQPKGGNTDPLPPRHDGQGNLIWPKSLSTRAALLQGQILELRIWDTARSETDLTADRYKQIKDIPNQKNLVLWWQFDLAQENSRNIDNLVANTTDQGHLGKSVKIEAMGTPPSYALPASTLDKTTIAHVADIKRHKENYRVPMNRLTALWHELQHTGKADERTLFDDTFNPKDSTFEPWPFHIDTPIRWDITGETNQALSRQIRSRLMGGLRVTHDNLNTIIATLSGPNETIIELDSTYLTNMYRLARLPGMLRLSVSEFNRLLKLMKLNRIDSLNTFNQVSERVDWMTQTGIDTFELDFLSNDEESESVSFPYDGDSIHDLADGLRRQSSEFLAQHDTFKTEEVNELLSKNLFELLRSLGVIDNLGAVLSSYEVPFRFDKLFILTTPQYTAIGEKRLNLKAAAYAALYNRQVRVLTSNNIIDKNGLVLCEDEYRIATPTDTVTFDDKRLKPLFATEDTATLARIREALEYALKIQVDLATKLIGMRDALTNATLEGLATLVGSTPEYTLQVVQHLDSTLTLKEFFVEMYNLNDDGQPIPNKLVGKPDGYLYQLSKILYLAGQFKLTLEETASLVDDASKFNVKKILQPDLADLTSLHLFTALKTNFSDTEGKLLNMMDASRRDKEAVVAAIHMLTDWDARQIESTLAYFDKVFADNRLAGLEHLRIVFDIAAKMGTDVDFVKQLADTNDLDYEFYTRQSADLLEVLRAHYNEEKWPGIIKPIRDRLAVQQRDALLALAMLNIPIEFTGRRSPDVLSEYLLLDLQTSSEVDTSRLVQAMASLQLYVQRCMMNLERGVDPASIPTDEWEWMKNYRVWEANRKVFLYPENYIEPELRDTKTPFFKELEQDLMQGEVDQELATLAFTNYLDKFADVANLKVVGSYLRTMPKEGGDADKILYLIGRTRTDPKAFYLRQVKNDTLWSPWEKIEISINSEFVTPVYAFNRLFIYWVEFAKVTESRDTDEKIKMGDTEMPIQENVDVYKAIVKFSHQNFSKGWIPSQTYMELGRHLEQNERIRPEWQRIYAQQLASFPTDSMFTVNAEKASLTALNNRRLPSGFKNEFSSHKFTLPNNSDLDIRVESEGQRWRITDTQSNQIYIVNKERESLNIFLAEERTEDQVQVLEIAEDTDLETSIPDMDMENLTWEFWVHFAKPANDQGEIKEEPLDLIEYNPAWGLSKTDFQVSVTNNVTKPDQTEVGRLQADYDAKSEALQKAKDEGKKPDELKPFEDALAEANKKLQEAKTAKSPNLTLTVLLNGTVVSGLTTTVDYDQWQHIAITMEYKSGSYTFKLYRSLDKGKDFANKPIPSGSATIKNVGGSSITLPQSKDVRIGGKEKRPTAYTTQMSEFRLWSDVKGPETILQEKSNRKGQSQADLSLFVMPLDRQESSQSTMKLVRSSLSFNAVVDPIPPEKRERILLFWGKEIQRSIRNTLENDQDFILSLRKDGVQPSYEVDLASSKLYVLSTTELSINDYAASDQTTLSRFAPDIRRFLTTTINADFKLSPTQVAQFRPVLGQLSAFDNVPDFLLYNSNLLRILVEITMGIDFTTIRRSNAITSNNYLLEKVSSHEAYFSDVVNQPGWYILDTTDEQLLIQSVPKDERQQLSTTEEKARFYVSDENWRGEYYNNHILAGTPDLVRSDPIVKFDWGTGSPGPGIKNEYYSVRWTRDMLFEAGDYQFMIISDDGMRLFVDDVLLISDWSTHGRRPSIGSKSMTYGWHKIRIEYFQAEGDAYAEFTLSKDGNEIQQQIATTSQGDNPQILKMYFESDEALSTSHPLNDFNFRFERLSTFAVHDLSLRLFAGGIDGLLSLASQNVEEKVFNTEYSPNPKLVIPPGYDAATGKVDNRIDFKGASGLYYEEIFFHIPFLIANHLNTNQNFAEAQKWYHYIFNPTITEPNAKTNGTSHPNDRYWQYRPFRELSLETLQQMLNNDQALEAYRKDPFDPHAIARLRINAYQKAIVMKYIDNLLDWGDSLFRQDTRESINEAAQLYFLAFNLLGERPKSKAVKDFRQVGTYDDVMDAQPNNLPDFLVELDQHITAPSMAPLNSTQTPNNTIVTDFGVTENDQFIGYWDRVEDRLFKIRHSLNIAGVFRQLALFQPPINPMDLVNAVAGGRDLGSVISDLNMPVPNYRYTYMLEKAKDLTATASSLGSALLGAIEKRSSADLTILANTHEAKILDMISDTKEKEIFVAEERINALETSKQSIDARIERYEKLLDEGLNGFEEAERGLKIANIPLKVAAGVFETLGELAAIVPDTDVGGNGVGGSPKATVGFGGKNFGAATKGIGKALRTGTEAIDGIAGLVAQAGQYSRRKHTWEFEQKIAEYELSQVETQINIAKLQLAMAHHDQLMHEKKIEQNQEIADFHRNKFANYNLYNWMVSRLSGLYFQAYKLAYDYAKLAEKALQFERGHDKKFISFGHWDSLKKGLLAGESLMLELKQMEKSNIDTHRRVQEIEKNISLKKSMPEVFAALIVEGTADFHLGEALYNRDFPGHYCRMLITIAVSIKGPSIDEYDSVHATLVQTGSRTLMQPNVDGVRYLLGFDGVDQPDSSVLRTNWRANQQIAISKTDKDNGAFLLRFMLDPRYYPFEGTGAVSSWRLEMPKDTNRFDFSTIEDVILHVNYSASYDNGSFRQAVIDEMRNLPDDS
ncbi:MAG: neuraminidase-like domain-containing protein [Chloroflexota bacterium]